MPSVNQALLDLRITAYCVVVCHDAGAANIIMTEQSAHNFPAQAYVLSGPALTAWQAKVPANKLVKQLAPYLKQAQLCFTGTGWSSENETNAIKMALANHTPVISLVDHWVNYQDRFTRNDLYVLPDAIIVTDDYAYNQAQQVLAERPIWQIDNLYLAQSAQQIMRLSEGYVSRSNILYLAEPVRVEWDKSHAHICAEYQGLALMLYHLSNTLSVDKSQQYTIRIRPHPSEDPHFYNRFIALAKAQHPHLVVKLDDSPNIQVSIARANRVYGLESFAMVLAMSSGKDVYSTLPPWAHTARLPHPQLQHLAQMYPNFNC
jgi:hypothetical protein